MYLDEIDLFVSSSLSLSHSHSLTLLEFTCLGQETNLPMYEIICFAFNIFWEFIGDCN
jgi:hypothetical protein